MSSINTAKYISIIIVVAFVFVAGILIGKVLTETNLSSYTNTAAFLKLQSLSLSIQQDLISGNICTIDVFKITKDRARLGARVDELEKSLGKTSPQTLALKAEYSLISIRQWLLVKELKEKCGLNATIILYFYTNIKDPEKSQSELQGYFLDYLYRKYPEKLVTYSLDSDLEEPTIAILMELYNVTQIPSLVIEGKIYSGYSDREHLEPLIIA